MKNLKVLPSLFSIAFALASFNIIVLAQSNENQIANLSSSGASVRFDVGAPHAAVTLTVIGPNDFSFTKEFKSGAVAEFTRHPLPVFEQFPPLGRSLPFSLRLPTGSSSLENASG